MVSELVLDLLMEIGVLSFVVPVGVLLAWRIRGRKSFKPAVAGLFIFLFFGFFFRRIPDLFFLQGNNPVSKMIIKNGLFVELYMGLVASLLEETGRFLAYKYLLKKDTSRFTAITYGIGHGGLEWMLALGITDLSYFVFATIYNNHAGDITDQSFLRIISGFTVTDLILDGVRQVLFFCLQICLSVIVLEAYRNQAERKRYFLIALVVHFLAYLPVGLYRGKIISNLLSVILFTAILIFAWFFAREIYRGMKKHDEEDGTEKKEDMEKKKGFAYAAKKLK